VCFHRRPRRFLLRTRPSFGTWRWRKLLQAGPCVQTEVANMCVCLSGSALTHRLLPLARAVCNARQWLSELAPHFYKFKGGDGEPAAGGEAREAEGNARKVPRH